MNELTISEISELNKLEATIHRTSNAFVECGLALDQIREKRLYRMAFDTFEEYCKAKWGWTRQRAYQLIDASKTVMGLPESDRKDVKTEYQASQIKKSNLNQKCKVNFGSSLDKKNDQKMINLDKTGYPIPDDIIEGWNRADSIGKDIMRKASELKCEIQKAKEIDDPAFREITNSAVTYAINIYGSLRQIIPHAVCTSCQGRNSKKCSFCSGRGYFSEHLYRNAVPEEIKRIRLKSKV